MKKLLNYRLILFIFAYLCLGIACGSLLAQNKTLLGYIIMAGLVLGAILFSAVYSGENRRKLKRNLITSLALILFAVFGAFSTYAQVNRYEKADLNSHTYSVTAKVIEVSNTTDYAMLILSEATLSGAKTFSTDYKIKLYVSGENIFEIGDYVNFNAKLEDMGVYYNGEFSTYNVDKMLKYSAQTSVERVTIIKNDKNIFESVNNKIKTTLKTCMSGNVFATAYALLTGNSDYFETSLLASYRYAGIAHIFAVSGLHIGILAGFLTWLLNKLFKKPIITFIIVVVICFLYSGVCGFSSSSIRATIMYALLSLAGLTGRKYDALSSLSLAGVIILSFSPLQLFNVGFQLSFAVVAGLILLSPKISKLFKFFPKKIANALGAVISAQIASIPICAGAFKQFSLISVAFNLLLLPVISVFYIALFVSVIASIITTLGRFILLPSAYFIKGINFVIGSLDYSFFMITEVSLGVTAVLYYAVVVLSSGLINVKRLTNIIICSVLSVTCLIGTIFITINAKNKSGIYVNGGEGTAITLVKTNTESALILSVSSRKVNRYYLQTVINLSQTNSVSGIIILADENADAQNIYTQIQPIVKTDKIFINQPVSDMMRQIMIKSFNVNLSSIIAGEIKIGNTFFNPLLDNAGGVSFNINGKSIAVFSKLNEINPLTIQNLSKQHILIAENRQDYLFYAISAENKISINSYGDFLTPAKLGVIKYEV